MKKKYQYTAFALIWFLLNGCNAEQEYQEKDNRAFVLMGTTVAGGMTRAAAGDRTVGISFDGGDMQPYLMNSSGTTLSPDGEVAKIYFQTAQQVIKVKGWSPRNIGNSFSVQTDQSGGLDGSDYLYAPEAEYTLGNCQTKSLTFYHQTAKVSVTLAADEGISLSGAQVKIVNTNLSASVQADGSLATATPTDGTSISMQEDGTKYEALVIPQTMTGKKFIEITINNGQDKYYYTPKEGEATLEAGKRYDYTITLKQEYIEVTVGKEQISWENGGSGSDNISQTTPTRVTLDNVSWGTNGIYTVEANSNVIIDGNSTVQTNKRIVIKEGAHVVLQNVVIRSTQENQDWYYGIEVKGTATIALEGTNTITGGNNNTMGPDVALQVSGGVLTITGSNEDQLTLKAGTGPICGALSLLKNASLIIYGGTINADASSSNSAPGIGARQRQSCGDITIAGGIVIAKGGKGGGSGLDACPGVGCGTLGTCGNITISGIDTQVTATKGGGTYDIGPGPYGSSCGTITILDNIEIKDGNGNPATIYGHPTN
ncbi:fimbrillin family protein [Phocaeicola sp.]